MKPIRKITTIEVNCTDIPGRVQFKDNPLLREKRILGIYAPNAEKSPSGKPIYNAASAYVTIVDKESRQTISDISLKDLAYTNNNGSVLHDCDIHFVAEKSYIDFIDVVAGSVVVLNVIYED